MPINKRCVVKSLKSDYSKIVRWTAICVVVFGVAYTIVWLSSIYQKQLLSFLNTGIYYLGIILSPINVFIGLEIITIVGVLYWLLFTHSEDLTDQKIKEILNESSTTPYCIMTTSLAMGFVYICYLILGWVLLSEHVFLPDVTIITVGLLAINTFIACPVAVSIARCKE